MTVGEVVGLGKAGCIHTLGVTPAEAGVQFWDAVKETGSRLSPG